MFFPSFTSDPVSPGEFQFVLEASCKSDFRIPEDARSLEALLDIHLGAVRTQTLSDAKKTRSPHENKVNMRNQLNKTKVCRHFLKGRCRYGSACTFAHWASELMPRPDFHKTKLCCRTECSDPSCQFAHSEAELRNPFQGLEGTICPELLVDGQCSREDACPFIHQITDQHELVIPEIAPSKRAAVSQLDEHGQPSTLSSGPFGSDPTAAVSPPVSCSSLLETPSSSTGVFNYLDAGSFEFHFAAPPQQSRHSKYSRPVSPLLPTPSLITYSGGMDAAKRCSSFGVAREGGQQGLSCGLTFAHVDESVSGDLASLLRECTDLSTNIGDAESADVEESREEDRSLLEFLSKIVSERSF